MIKALDIWLPAWLRRPRGNPASSSPVHVLFCVCDHFEPFHGADKSEAMARMATWRREFAKITAAHRDSGGTPPRHTFFYPIEQYDPDVIHELTALCQENGGETEIHLHHDRDTADNLRAALIKGRERLGGHGLLSRDPAGEIRYGFIHGNWALDNSHPEGRNCGVKNELAVLRQTGCYADFTLPSAPNRTQTHTINSLYYATGTEHPKSHDRGRPVDAEVKTSFENPNELLMVQGPLGLNWRRRKAGVLPRIENSDLTGANPPTRDRLRVWLECRIAVRGRPDWLFVKLHTHGAKPSNSTMLLGEPMHGFHRMLAQKAAENARFRYHYVTARELVNILHAAEDGHSGDPAAYRNYRYRTLHPAAVSE